MAWLTGWTYRKAITIAHSDDGAQTDYQIKLLVGESSGATGEQVDCAGHVLSSFNDLRFTTADGETLCPYWIESITGATPNQLATVWVKIPSIAAHPDDTTIYMYYGNAGASAASSGANTFITFDDFERGNNDDTIGGSWTESVAHVHISTDHAYGGTRSAKWVGSALIPEANIAVSPSSSQAIRFRVWKEDAAAMHMKHGNGAKVVYPYFEADEDIMYFDGAAKDTGDNITPDNWQLFELRNFNFTAGTFDIYYNGAEIQAAAGMWTYAGFNGVLSINNPSQSVGVDIYVDDFLVRKFTANEPAFASAGIEGVSLFPSGIATAEAIGSHNLAYLQTLLPDAIISAEALGNSKLILFLLPSAIDSGEAIGNPVLELFILPSAILTAEVVGDPALGKYRLAGSVTLLGVGVSGAIIRALNQVTGECAEATTDIDGNYMIVLQANDAHHIAVEYENGQKYNALSKWDVIPA
ncbi:MAG: DUF2341 domain-containing protein [Dehalococcoidia bacterium]|nr:DUF2341 domain-containing protein [Dehalococcoidia bacterium]